MKNETRRENHEETRRTDMAKRLARRRMHNYPYRHLPSVSKEESSTLVVEPHELDVGISIF